MTGQRPSKGQVNAREQDRRFERGQIEVQVKPPRRGPSADVQPVGSSEPGRAALSIPPPTKQEK